MSYRRISKEMSEFNKEILFGELGAIIGTQTFGYISSKLTNFENVISFFVVLGAIIFASLFWLFLRYYHKQKKGYGVKEIIKDTFYFTPVSAILTILLYYPTLFLITKYLLINKLNVHFSAIIAQTIAFFLFLLGINVYRKFLIKYFKKIL